MKLLESVCYIILESVCYIVLENSFSFTLKSVCKWGIFKFHFRTYFWVSLLYTFSTYNVKYTFEYPQIWKYLWACGYSSSFKLNKIIGHGITQGRFCSKAVKLWHFFIKTLLWSYFLNFECKRGHFRLKLNIKYFHLWILILKNIYFK